MTQRLRTLGYGATLVAIFAMLVSSGATVNAQQAPAPGQLLSPDQLDYMVAPIALYPDPLISQILVAATYPLEIVEANQWLQRNPNTRGAALTQAALDQDWDPSIQALVVFPDVLKYLTEDISWTTNLGNAFLAQEADVMDAIQRMRDRAAQSGKLKTTAEQQVIQTYDAGQPVYEIVPTNPTVIYVPVYDPYWIWGVPVYYPYARWYYPPHAPYLYFNSGIYIDAYFGPTWYGAAYYGPGYRVWNNWGWRPAWNTHTVVVNNVFIDNHRFNSNQQRYATATTSWSHDASHRRGVVYPASSSYDRYRRDPRDVPRPQQVQGQGRSVPAQAMTRNAGPSNVSSAPRSVDRSNDRPDGRPDLRQDVRQDGRQDVRQDGRQNGPQAGQQGGRPDVRQDGRQDSRIAAGSATSNAPNRDNRGSSDFRGDRGNTNSGPNRAGSSPVQMATTLPTHVTPAQVSLSRPTTPAPDLSQPRGGSQAQPAFRESQAGRNTGTSVTRTTSQAPSRETMTARVGQQEYSPRQSDPYRGTANSNVQSSVSRQASPVRQAAPSGSYAPSQQTRSSVVTPSTSQSSSPRQSASAPGGSASVGRAAPAQSGPPSNAQGNGHGSNNGSHGGGNSGGRR